MKVVIESPVARLTFQRHCLRHVVIPLAISLIFPAAAEAFPINAPNARTLFGGFTLGSPRSRVTREATLKEGTSSVTNPQDQVVTTFEEDVTVVYGLTGDFTVGATLPIMQRRLRFDTPEGKHQSISADGLGDLTLVGAYRFYRRDVQRGRTQFSFLGGLYAEEGINQRRTVKKGEKRASIMASATLAISVPGKSPSAPERRTGALEDSAAPCALLYGSPRRMTTRSRRTNDTSCRMSARIRVKNSRMSHTTALQDRVQPRWWNPKYRFNVEV